MKKILIISKHYGVNTRGAEVWIDTIKEKLRKNFEISVINKIEFLKILNSDIVIPIDGRLQAVCVRLITWLVGKSVVIFGHSGLGADDKWNLICSPNIFVAFSNYQKEWAEKFKMSWTKVIRIPHAVDLAKFVPAKTKPGKKVVLCVAANTPAKRVNLVADAVKLVSGATFLAVGNLNKVQVSNDEMPKIYQKADVFCFTPNYWEAFGLVFLEAMATNLPVVTANDPIRKEIIGDAGILVNNPENTNDLADAILLALNNKWSNLPRKQAEKFSWDKIARKYIDLFNNLA